MASRALVAAKFLVLLIWLSLIYLPTRICSYYRATSASQLCVLCMCMCVCVYCIGASMDLKHQDMTALL